MASKPEPEKTGAFGRPLLFGEILFDEFPDGATRIGGSPLNVALHLRGLGLDPLLVSRVGADALGELALERLRAANVDTSGVQIDPRRPTGRARIALGAAGPQFTIPAEQAYDHIDASATQPLTATPFELLYHGTLAARSGASAAALQALRALGLPALVDLNLRPPWWQRSTVESLLVGARWLKLDTDELVELEDHGRGRTLLERAQSLRSRFGLDAVIVTSGGEGAFAVTADETVTAAPERVAEIEDLVAAGDAFAAVIVLGTVRHWSWLATLRRAVEFATAVAGTAPASAERAGLHADFLERWRF